MFDLEKAMTAWREELSRAGITHTEVLEELETHVREHVGQQVSCGCSEEKAFETAKLMLGESKALKAEFVKVARKRNRSVHKLLLAASCFNILIGLLWMAMAFWEGSTVYRVWKQGATFDPGDRAYLVCGACTDNWGVSCAVIAIWAAIEIFRSRRRGLTLLTIAIVLAIVGMLADFGWRYMLMRRFTPLFDCVVLSYPVGLWLLSRKNGLKEGYV